MRHDPKSYFASLGGRLLSIAGIGAAVFVALRVGYGLHDQEPPPEFNYFYYPALTIFMAALLTPLVWLLPWLGDSIKTAVARCQMRQELEATRRQRVAELAADPDPKRRKYAARVAGGEAWPNENIDYEEDPARLATCVHLQPIERAMRAAGVELHFHAGATVSSRCVVDPVVWQNHYPDAYPVEWVESLWYERAAPTVEADLVCAQCQSRIQIWHPRYAGNLPWFPAAPRGKDEA